MSLKEKMVSSFLAFELDTDINSKVHDIRTKSIKDFEKIGFPTKKNEYWKYTPINKVLNDNLTIFKKERHLIEFEKVKDFFISGIESYKIVFIDGTFDPVWSDTTHEGVDVCIISSILENNKYDEIINKYYNTLIDENESFSLLNSSFSKEGAFIHVPKNIELEKPVEIIHINSGGESSLMLQPRNLVILEKNSKAQIFESHYSISRKNHNLKHSSNGFTDPLTNTLTEVHINEGANLEYFKIQNDLVTTSLIDNTYINQKKNSEVSCHTFSFGGNIVRNNLNFYQNGKNVNSIMKGITILDDNQHVDHHTLVHHANPNCESYQEYKGIYNGSSTGVFNGRVLVDKIAQKINAFQQNNNLLVGEGSSVNAKPQLEIFADDVKCSHGCTIGQLDESALFYLKTRGISEVDAKGLLTYAFANNVLENVKIQALKTKINQIIANKIGVKLGFEL
jgi:Fe-S cluster assembly protein SufD